MTTHHENTVAIAELTILAQQTTKDLDRVIKHLDLAPVARTIALEKRMNKVELRLPYAVSKTVVMWGVAILIGSLGSFIGLAYYEITGYNRILSKEIHKLDNSISVIHKVCDTHGKLLSKLGEKHEK